MPGGNFQEYGESLHSPDRMLLPERRQQCKGVPNENYARELQELYTVGKGPVRITPKTM